MVTKPHLISCTLISGLSDETMAESLGHLDWFYYLPSFACWQVCSFDGLFVCLSEHNIAHNVQTLWHIFTTFDTDVRLCTEPTDFQIDRRNIHNTFRNVNFAAPLRMRFVYYFDPTLNALRLPMSQWSGLENYEYISHLDPTLTTNMTTIKQPCAHLWCMLNVCCFDDVLCQ